MRIGFLIGDIETEKAGYTTLRLAITAVNRGHEAWMIGAGDLAFDADEKIRARAVGTEVRKYTTSAAYLKELLGDKAKRERITVDDLDILMLRNNPANESGYRNWAKTAGIIFGNMAVRSGVIVLNDPMALSGALDKMYMQILPGDIRPKTLISCNRDELKAFVQELGGTAVLKGFQGNSAQAVFLVTRDNRSNLNQMIDAIARYGYVIAQEYLRGSEQGSVRMYLMNGEPLVYKGKAAAFQWVRSEEGIRSNIHAPGSVQAVKLTAVHYHIAEAVRPRLVQDGMFLAGLEIIDDKLIDIDVFSPDGLVTAQSLEKVNFAEAIVQALERKVDYMAYYRRRFDNVDMATL
jgi:glutathione synthase